MANIKGSNTGWGCVRQAIKAYLKLTNWQIDKVFEFMKTDLPETPKDLGAPKQTTTTEVNEENQKTK